MTTTVHDGLSGRGNESNHNWAMDTAGTRDFAGDLNTKGINSTWIEVNSNITLTSLECYYFNNSDCAKMCFNASGCMVFSICGSTSENAVCP